MNFLDDYTEELRKKFADDEARKLALWNAMTPEQQAAATAQANAKSDKFWSDHEAALLAATESASPEDDDDSEGDEENEEEAP